MSELNPYQAPLVGEAPNTPPPALTAEQVRGMLIVPAYGLLLSLVVNWLHVPYLVFLTAVDFFGRDEPDAAGGTIFLVLFLAFYLLWSYFLVRGFVAMRRLRDPRAAMWGAWMAVLPCAAGCFVAWPFAIWADWVLRDPRVHAAFQPARLT